MKTKARKYPFVISVRQPDGTTEYLAGHGSKDGKGLETVCLFTSNVDNAVSSMSRDNMFCGWPMLLSSHCRTMGVKLQAVVHQTNETPDFES
jgi:hypothetical protein